VEAAPAKPSPAALRAAKAHFRQGKAFYEAGVYGDAIASYEKAYALAPLPELLFNIGQAHRMAGDKVKAIASYERYLEAAAEGSLAEEARGHVAMLKSRIQLEEAEAARKKAEAEAAEARRRAEEAEAARKRAEAQAAEGRKAKDEDEERLRRLAAEEAARTEAAERKRAEVESEARLRRLAEAEPVGRTHRRVGLGLTLSGVTTLVVYGVLVGVFVRDHKRLSDFDKSQDGEPWTDRLETSERNQKPLFVSMVLTGSLGLALFVTGQVLGSVGRAHRAKAKEMADHQVEVLPQVSPGAAGLLVQGRF